MAIPADRILTIQEAAERLGLPAEVVTRLVRETTLWATKMDDGGWGIRESAVQRFIEANPQLKEKGSDVSLFQRTYTDKTAAKGEAVPAPRMRLHPLAPEVKCPNCGAGLTFIRMRGYGDLYQCVSDPCRCQVMHYQRKDSKICGYAAITHLGSFGEWIACDMPTEKEK